ncbi:MAG: helix-turn-helix transcriptional regulator [Gammaproteobacteria bacterium]|nr:helix-turn-helix transcriptional regulator [Gammaproteobacteria bacterium]
MQPVFTLFSIIMLIGAAHGLFLALALVNTREAAVAGRLFIALLTLAFAIDLGHEFLTQSRYLLQVPSLAYVDPIINLAYGPSFYLYTCALIEGDTFRYRHHLWLHYLPLGVAAALCATLPALSADDVAALFYAEAGMVTGERVNSIVLWIAQAAVVSIGAYLFASLRRLLRHARWVRQQFSSIEHVTLNWLRNLLLALSVLYGILLVDGFIAGPLGFDEDMNRLLYLAVVIVIYAMGYLGMRQPAIFTTRTPVATRPDDAVGEMPTQVGSGAPQPEPEPESKYRSSALDTQLSQALSLDLTRHMEQNRPYLESQLTLPQLADQLAISPNYLSQVINEQLQMNFFDFVNGYRVKDAQLMLTGDSADERSILDIAYAAGFNSKSAFYTAFKKRTGVTPSEFRKAARAKEEIAE